MNWHWKTCQRVYRMVIVDLLKFAYSMDGRNLWFLRGRIFELHSHNCGNRQLISALLILAYQITTFSLMIDDYCIQSMWYTTNALVFNVLCEQSIVQLIALIWDNLFIRSKLEILVRHSINAYQFLKIFLRLFSPLHY